MNDTMKNFIDHSYTIVEADKISKLVDIKKAIYAFSCKELSLKKISIDNFYDNFHKLKINKIKINNYRIKLIKFLTSNKNLTNPRLMPSPYYSYPNENDEKEGSYVRYFAKRNTNFMYLEISKDVYSKLKAKDPSYACELYECIKLPWSLIINDDAINEGEVERIEKEKN